MKLTAAEMEAEESIEGAEGQWFLRNGLIVKRTSDDEFDTVGFWDPPLGDLL